MRAVRLVAVLLGLALLAVGWLLSRDDSGPRGPRPDEGPDRARPAETVLVVPAEDVIGVRPAGQQPVPASAAEAARLADAYSFEGQGTIRGRIGARPGTLPPREWDLVLEPHPMLRGSERAEFRRVKFRAGERDFRIEGLRLGGYRVRAEADGLNSSSADVLLVKGSPDQFTELALSPAGWLDGSVLDAQGQPAEGVEVELQEVVTRARLTTTTDAGGAFEFRSLLDGEYTLHFGAAGHRLLPEELVSFRAPRLTYPARTLPPAACLVVTVLGRLGEPAAGVRVSGYGRPEGSFDVRSDDQGRATVRWLSAGTWRVNAVDEGEGLSARGTLDVAAGEPAELTLRLLR